MMKRLALLSLLPISAYVQAEAVSDIYQPDTRQVRVSGQEAIPVRNAMLGIGAVYQSQDNLESRLGVNMSVRWLASDRWYVSGEYQHAPFNQDAVVQDGAVVVEANENASVLAAGMGYAVMQGNASFNGRRSYPWQLAVEMFAGEQFTGDTSGRYTALGFSWQIIERDCWVAMGWRIYQTNDERLSKLDVNSGAQWGVSFGFWF